MKKREVIIMKKINEILQEKLEGQNISALAKEIGISRTLLHDWVAARRLPSLKNLDALRKLADHINVSLEFLLTGQDDGRKILTSVIFQDESREYQINIIRRK